MWATGLRDGPSVRRRRVGASGQRPPKVRWSTNRSSGRRRRSEPGVQVLLAPARPGGCDQQLAAHAQVDDQGLPVGPSGAARTSQRYLPRRSAAVTGGPSAGRRGRPGRARGGGRRGCRGTRPRRPAADDVACQAAADDLDLGELRHRRGAGASGWSRRRVDRARARGWAAGARRARSRRCSAACCSASFLLRPVPSPRTSSPTTGAGGEDLLVVRALLGDAGTPGRRAWPRR